MKIQIEIELNDAMAIVAAFSPIARNDFMKKKGEEALERLEKQIDEIVNSIGEADEQRFH